MPAPLPLIQKELSEMLGPMTPGRGQSVAVAVSGGADSLALALMLGPWCRDHGVGLTALTVDHGLRKAAADEARQVGRWLKQHDIPHVILTWRGEKPDSNIQDQARLARYRLMGEWCRAQGVGKLFLAHHQDDQAETFLIRLFRGSGVDGLAAMQAMTDFPLPLLDAEGDKLMLCRPLLSVAKDRLKATLRHMDQPWIEDPSNENESYTRVRVRRLLNDSDIEGLNAERLARTAGRMARVRSLLQGLTDELATKAVTCFPQGHCVVRLAPLLAAHEEIALRLLARLTRRVSGGAYGPRLGRLEALYVKLKAGTFAGQTLGGCRILPERRDGIIVCREAAAITDSRHVAPQSTLLWDGRFVIKNGPCAGTVKRLDLAAWQAACRDRPALKKIRLLKAVRDSLPCVLADGGGVLLPDFIPGFEETGFCARLRSLEPDNGL